MTRILFDAMSLDDKPSGTRTRLVRLVPALAERGHVVWVAHGPQLDEQARTLMKDAVLLEISLPPGPGPLRRLSLQRLIYRRLTARANPEVVSAETWPMPKVQGLFPVIHDLRYLSLSLPLRRLFVRFLLDGCSRARRIHTDSATVSRQLQDRFSIDPARVDVVPIGVEVPDLEELNKAEPLFEQPYVLVVGHYEPRKDFFLVGELAKKLHPLGILMVRVGRGIGQRASRGYRAGKFEDVPEPSEDSPMINLGIVGDEQRDILFRQATAVLVPSRYEGFGLVGLEALAAGAWTVASDIPAHREVLSSAVSYFPPGDHTLALQHIIEACNAKEGERVERCLKARSQAEQFSPQRSADAFVSSLRKAELID